MTHSSYYRHTSGKSKYKIYDGKRSISLSMHDSNSNVPTNIIAIWEHWPPILIKKQCKEVETLNCT